MRYRKPFTADQYRDAVAKYWSYRRNVVTLRRLKPPSTRAQRARLRDYQRVVQEFGATLLGPLRDINVERLNALDIQAVFALTEHFASKTE
jgi:hypothetical protein